jgi:hypothetical protein
MIVSVGIKSHYVHDHHWPDGNIYLCYLNMLYQALARMPDQDATCVNGIPFSLVATQNCYLSERPTGQANPHSSSLL